MTTKVVTKSIFGDEIDSKCKGYSWFGKLLVFLGIIASEIDSNEYAKIDEDLDRRERERKK
jgi:hypothetical protein